MKKYVRLNHPHAQPQAGQIGGGQEEPKSNHPTVILAPEFGAPHSDRDVGKANRAIARHIISLIKQEEDQNEIIVLAQASVAREVDRLLRISSELPHGGTGVINVIATSEGSSRLFGGKNADGKRGDCFDFLVDCRNILQNFDFRGDLLSENPNPIVLATAKSLEKRAQRQAHKLGLATVIAPGNPLVFDERSPQPWCRGPWQWAIREACGAIPLRLMGRL